MNLKYQIKIQFRYQILLVIATFLGCLWADKVVALKIATDRTNSQTVFSTQNTYKISQNFLNVSFNSNYYSKLMEADHFYKQGNLAKVKEIQRQVKANFTEVAPPPPPQVDLEQLSPGGKVYWRIANEGMKQGLESKIFVPLTKLTETSPDFIPGHLLLVEANERYEKHEEALSAIERLAELYPEQTDVLDRKIELLAKNKKHLEASIAARQFTIIYPNHPESSRYQEIAEQQKKIYLKKLKQEAIALDLSGSTYNNQIELFNSPGTVLNKEVQAVQAYLKQNNEEVLRRLN